MNFGNYYFVTLQPKGYRGPWDRRPCWCSVQSTSISQHLRRLESLQQRTGRVINAFRVARAIRSHNRQMVPSFSFGADDIRPVFSLMYIYFGQGALFASFRARRGSALPISSWRRRRIAADSKKEAKRIAAAVIHSVPSRNDSGQVIRQKYGLQVNKTNLFTWTVFNELKMQSSLAASYSTKYYCCCLLNIYLKYGLTSVHPVQCFYTLYN